jgi:hypothetical protein
MSASPASLAGAVMIGVSPVAGGTEVTFPRAGDRDWIVLGSRPDGVAVRNKRPSQALGTVTTPGAAASVVDGPYRIAYTGGVPQQSSAGAGTWQLVTADKSSQQVTVPLHGGTFTVDLFAGTVRTTGVVTVRLSGSGPVTPATAIVPPCRADVCAGRGVRDSALPPSRCADRRPLRPLGVPCGRGGVMLRRSIAAGSRRSSACTRGATVMLGPSVLANAR